MFLSEHTSKFPLRLQEPCAVWGVRHRVPVLKACPELHAGKQKAAENIACNISCQLDDIFTDFHRCLSYIEALHQFLQMFRLLRWASYSPISSL